MKLTDLLTSDDLQGFNVPDAAIRMAKDCKRLEDTYGQQTFDMAVFLARDSSPEEIKHTFGCIMTAFTAIDQALQHKYALEKQP